MLLILHVFIAIASILQASAGLVRPSQTQYRLSVSLVVATLVTGTALVISTSSPLIGSCVTGLVYLSIVMALLVPTRYRLTKSID